jgi:hypothetical protein
VAKHGGDLAEAVRPGNLDGKLTRASVAARDRSVGEFFPTGEAGENGESLVVGHCAGADPKRFGSG